MGNTSLKIERAETKRRSTAIKVEYVHSRKYVNVSNVLLSLFLLGGISFGLYSYEQLFPLRFFSNSVEGQLGAVGASDLFDATQNIGTVITDANSPLEPVVSPTTPVTQNSEAPLETESAAAREERITRERAEREDLTVQISETKAEAGRLRAAIEQVQNDAVAQVVAFNQNCGIWEDPCALSYERALEENNAAYAVLTKKLAETTRVLEQIEERWSELLP